MFSLFKRRMPDNEVRAVAEMQKKIDDYEHAFDGLVFLLSGLPMTFREIDDFSVKYVVDVTKRILKDKDRLERKVKDLTAELMDAREDLRRVTTVPADLIRADQMSGPTDKAQ